MGLGAPDVADEGLDLPLGRLPREARDRPSAAADLVAGAASRCSSGSLMIPWAILQRLTYVVLRAAVGRERLPGTATLDWLVRWRQTILGWANACAEAAPIADVYHGHDLTGLPGRARRGPAQRRAGRVRQPRDLPGGRLYGQPAALGALVLPAPRAGLDPPDGGARDGQPLARGDPDAALSPPPHASSCTTRRRAGRCRRRRAHLIRDGAGPRPDDPDRALPRRLLGASRPRGARGGDPASPVWSACMPSILGYGSKTRLAGRRSRRPALRRPAPRARGRPAGSAARLGGRCRRRRHADPDLDAEPLPVDAEQAVRMPGGGRARWSRATSRRCAGSSWTTPTVRWACSAGPTIRPTSRAASARSSTLPPDERGRPSAALPQGGPRPLELGDRIAASRRALCGS